jgi:probable rRNA maturation factor
MPVLVDNRQRSVAVDRRAMTRAAERALSGVGRAGSAVEITVVADPEIRRLNRAHRGIARRTDVLAFPMESPAAAGGLVGMVVVSAETAARQARRVGVPVALEMALLVTHGVLHLVGYDDRDPVEAALMHRRERDLLREGRPRVPARLWSGLLAPEPPSAQDRGGSGRGKSRVAPAGPGRPERLGVGGPSRGPHPE